MVEMIVYYCGTRRAARTYDTLRLQRERYENDLR